MEPNESGAPRARNRLADETSPYLLQHRTNPVAWQPWDDAALERARTERKPIFLSVGYSSCHWCHVMERESFENEAIARVLNEHFVSIKVDREERPDIDETYMKAVQLMTGSGGWPMSVFLTPDLQPFYGGTYFPPTDRYGRPGFLSVLNYLAGLWRDDRDKAIASGRQLVQHIAKISGAATTPAPATRQSIQDAVAALEGLFDRRDGGFGGAPKFPHAMDLAFLLRVFARGEARVRPILDVTLEKMARGGIYDQAGGGFHRYSTDESWLVPHFEKMLYDNALLAPVYAEASRALGGSLFERIARETCDYVLREMTDPEGGFHSATDADSEGEEGRYFVWKRDEIVSLLGKRDGEDFCRFFGVSEGGNFEHATNILSQIGPEAEQSRHRASLDRLVAARRLRVPPALDDKVLVEWNGLMIGGLARAGACLREPRFVAAAERAADFVLRDMLLRDDGPRLLRSWRAGKAHIDGFLSDYANFIHGLLELCAESPDPRWLDTAIALTAQVRRHFAADGGGFYATADRHEKLIVRSRDPYDNATPSGNSVMATNLLRLAHWTGDPELFAEAERTIAAFAPMVSESPAGFGWMLQAIDLFLDEPTSVLIVGAKSDEGAAKLCAVVARTFRPGVFVLRTDGARAADPHAPEILRDRPADPRGAVAYVCRGKTCLLPTADPAALERALDTK